jgi:hypothetical protein
MLESLGTLEKVFLTLWVVFGTLYWLNYRKTENLLVSLLKVGALLGFVWSVMRGFDWLRHPVPPAEAIVFWGPEPTLDTSINPSIVDTFASTVGFSFNSIIVCVVIGPIDASLTL